MPIIYASDSGTSYDGVIASTSTICWAGARDASAGGYVQDWFSGYAAATAAARTAGRRGGTTYSVNRSFFCFDTSSITSTVSSATIKVRGYLYNSGSVIPVKSTAFGGDGGTDLTVGDFDAISGYSAGSSLAGSATVYGPQIITSNWSTSGYNDFTGTSDLLADMQNNDAVIICFMDYGYDYKNVALTSNNTYYCGLYYAEAYGSSDDPQIDYTLATAGYVHNVTGVAAANIGKVKGVATANIEKVIGV